MLNCCRTVLAQSRVINLSLVCDPGLEKNYCFFQTKNRFFGVLGFYVLTYKSQTQKLRPTSTVESKDKSSEQRFGHVNATNRNLYSNIIFIKCYAITENL